MASRTTKTTRNTKSLNLRNGKLAVSPSRQKTEKTKNNKPATKTTERGARQTPGRFSSERSERKESRGQNGYMDRHGNEWVWDPVKGEWDVQLGRSGRGQLRWLSRSGRHINVSPDGRVTH
jgi:hypothetical protein